MNGELRGPTTKAWEDGMGKSMHCHLQPLTSMPCAVQQQQQERFISDQGMEQ